MACALVLLVVSSAQAATALYSLYYYRVRARNTTDSSGYSNVVNANTPAPPTAYQATVVADAPVSYWRLGEASGTAAADVRGANQGIYANGPGLGSAGLLTSDPSNKAVAFDGVDDHVLRGIIDKPAIFPTALPAARVKAHYDAGIASGT